MKKNELFGLKNMFLSNNIASVGVKISSPHTEGFAFYSSTAVHAREVDQETPPVQLCAGQFGKIPTLRWLTDLEDCITPNSIAGTHRVRHSIYHYYHSMS